jgi:uncharacterized membrane protein YgdD (TMEM256/DUF423 family)
MHIKFSRGQWIIIAILGTIAVSLGAFGAHALKDALSPTQIETFKTASLYHFVHLIAMCIVSILWSLSDKKNVMSLSFYLFGIGIIFFSGSLYVLSTRHLIGGDVWNFVGPITPIGGLCFILAWLNLIRVSN